MSLITVLGASGFIGSHLVAELASRGTDHLAIQRDDELTGCNLGDVIYCLGLTADFRTKPLETVEAHVCKLRDLIVSCEFDSITYLSSTRIYGSDSQTASETDSLKVDPSQPEDLYNISKLMGESLTLNCRRKARVVRLSNVYGDDFDSMNFLPTIIFEALRNAKITLHSSPESAKDYVNINDVVRHLPKIATGGTAQIYNVASGRNVTNAELAAAIRETTGCQVTFDNKAPRISFPEINIDRVRSEFGFEPRSLLEDLDDLVATYRSAIDGSRMRAGEK